MFEQPRLGERGRRRHRLSKLLVAGALVVMAASCGSDESGDDGADTTVAVTAATTTSPALPETGKISLGTISDGQNVFEKFYGDGRITTDLVSPTGESETVISSGCSSEHEYVGTLTDDGLYLFGSPTKDFIIDEFAPYCTDELTEAEVRQIFQTGQPVT